MMNVFSNPIDLQYPEGAGGYRVSYRLAVFSITSSN